MGPGHVGDNSLTVFNCVWHGLREEIHWESRGLWSPREGLGQLFSGSNLLLRPEPAPCPDMAVHVTEGGHGDCVVRVVALQ